MFTTILVLFLGLAITVNGLGCIPQLCEGFEGNQIANSDCSNNPKHCGAYGGKRFDNSLVKGIDIQCNPNKKVYAPFSGSLSFYRPRGGQNSSKCLDSGLRIVGSGQWTGYIAQIAYIKPTKYSTEVQQNDEIGTSIDQTCTPMADSQQTPHIMFQLFHQGKPIDPTYKVFDCMCTGQICQSNINNNFVQKDTPYIHKSGYGKGYELNCGNVKDDKGAESEPLIYSPIEASFLGRFRPKNVSQTNPTFTCDNDGVFLEGTGKWRSFTVHIYNVHFLMEPEYRHVPQGAEIARRLNCRDYPMDTIFLEFRYEGQLVNITNMISADNCKKPKLPL